MPIDYKSFSPEGPDANQPNVQRWWNAKSKAEMAQGIMATINTLIQSDSRRQSQYQTSARLYGNVNMIGISGLSMMRNANLPAATKERVTYNVVQSGIDTVQAKMIKNKPKPLCLTSGGDWKAQRRAEKLTKFGEGVFYENHAYDVGREVFRDAAVLGDGFIYVFNHYGRCKWERVLPGELLVDQMEALYGNPRQLHRVKNVDRLQLADMFPEKRSAIMEAASARLDPSNVPQTISDQITVAESWHLRSGPDAKDGKRVIAIDNVVLEEDTWDKDYFPFARFQWTPRLYGYWSQGGAEQIQNIQLEINKLLWVIQRSMHMAGTFKILAERGAKIVKEHFTNDFGIVLEYTGTPPSYILPPIVPPEIYAHLMTLKNAAYEQLGVSMLSAASKKPEGLNSGKALREFSDIESERFQTIGQRWETFYLELFKLSVDVVKEIFEDEGSYEVKIPGKRFLETIDWKDVAMEDDEYVTKVYPVSSLPSDPAGRLQTIQEYMQAGLISPRVGRRLLDFPDLEREETMAGSQEDWLQEMIERMIDDGEPYQLEPEDDRALAKELALEYIAYAKVNKVEEDRLQLLRDFLTSINMEAQQAQQAAMAQQAMQAQAQQPQAVPAAPPVSDLMPNAPSAA